MRALSAWLAAVLLLAVGPAAAERVVTLAPHLAELVCAVNACDQLVGVGEYTDAPPQAARLPKVGSALAINLEALLALQPSLVLIWDGGTPVAQVARLKALGLRSESFRIRDLDGIADALERLGRRLGHAEAAQAAAQAYRQRLAALRAQYRDRPRLRVFYQIDSGPVYTINRDSPIHAALELCGADNVFAALPTVSATVSAEAILAADPDVVVYTNFEDPRSVSAFWSRLKGARAAAPQRRFSVDANVLTRQSPRVLDGIAQLCEGLDRFRRDAR